jgi:hypothetical protein
MEEEEEEEEEELENPGGIGHERIIQKNMTKVFCERLKLQCASELHPRWSAGDHTLCLSVSVSVSLSLSNSFLSCKIRTP